ncbi:polyprenyl diphosphate synthase [Streptomyces griseocarneus]|uniref:polyprenyl diphosphate synthase n=1 Tax=Streptomyces griseocarneus TaxID=51201 RepID=UPI00167E5282|nr:polyprenyl diphosphate synthase [Streptomyces griseocarneus]MBZ6473575.1 di-trans,poly-cis-decaprenylcistransferase [Streptomyces griseocarneus]GHG56251.1 isoprenyl transferase [Streptomyces griseocarneus]
MMSAALLDLERYCVRLADEPAGASGDEGRDERPGPAPCGALPRVPRHLAVILDGNRRWAERHQRPFADAYRSGASRVCELVTWCERAGVPFVTVWALSRDNLRRGPDAVAEILRAVTDGTRAMADEGRRRIRVIGSLDRLPPDGAEALRRIEEDTRGATGTTVNVAIAYSGRGDIVDAVCALARLGCDGPPPSPAVLERRLAGQLSTAGQPDVDLVIRSSGEQRLSGFMLWQTAEAELYFTETLWPDFTEADFTAALHAYTARDRRHGR